MSMKLLMMIEDLLTDLKNFVAPKNTAVSNAQLTNTRIGYLDNLATMKTGGIPVVKRVQRGYISQMSFPTNPYVTVNFANVNTAKSIILINSSFVTYSGATMPTYPVVSEFTSTSFTLRSYSNGGNFLSWQVIEFY